MDNPIYSHDAAGRWIWRTKLFCSDRTFGSESAAIKNYEALKEVYENSEVVKSEYIPWWPLEPVDLWDWWSTFYSPGDYRSIEIKTLGFRIWPITTDGLDKDYQGKRQRRRNRHRDK
ncbi:hypothetical protein Lepto7375DRAFT_7422 [Leptolyngbya sp. PCC 7375]|nr:hypothetical protein Lepto7375DRAFT_7422 [Leptolyngbya sp. PCC 7375]